MTSKQIIMNCKVMQRLYDHFLTRTYTVSQLVWSQAFPVHIWIVSCDVAWPPVSSLPFVRVSVYVCLGCACSSEVSVLVHSSYFVGPWSLRQQLACALEEETICFILSADKPRGMTPASYMYIHTIYRYDKILKVYEGSENKTPVFIVVNPQTGILLTF